MKLFILKTGSLNQEFVKSYKVLDCQDDFIAFFCRMAFNCFFWSSAAGMSYFSLLLQIYHRNTVSH